MKRDVTSSHQEFINKKQVNFRCQHVQGEEPEFATATVFLTNADEHPAKVKSTLTVTKNFKTKAFDINVRNVTSPEDYSEFVAPVIAGLDKFIKEL